MMATNTDAFLLKDDGSGELTRHEAGAEKKEKSTYGGDRDERKVHSKLVTRRHPSTYDFTGEIGSMVLLVNKIGKEVPLLAPIFGSASCVNTKYRGEEQASLRHSERPKPLN